ncbi:MAG: group 1 truncated hemoglobin [Kiloniellales bacterium]
MAQSVFERCGGFQKVRKVVSNFYDKVLESEQLQGYFESTDMARLVDHQTKFIAQIMGGPVSINDDTLRKVHLSLGISHSDFKEAAALLQEALEDSNFADSDIAEILEAFGQREGLIVYQGGA